MSRSLPRLQEVFEDLLGPCCPNIGENDRVVDLGLDSLDREELAMVVEERFEIQITVDDLNRLSSETATVKDWTDYLDQNS